MPVLTRSMAKKGADKLEVVLPKTNAKTKKSKDGRKKEVTFDSETSSPAAKKTKKGTIKAKSKGKPRGRPQKKKTSPQLKASPQEKPPKHTESRETSATSPATEASTKQPGISTIPPSSPHLSEPIPAGNSSPVVLPEEDTLINLSKTLEDLQKLPSPYRKKSSIRRRISAVPFLPNILEASEDSSPSSRPELLETESEELTPPNQVRNTLQTPSTQRVVVFVKPGNTSVRRSHLQPHERIVQKAATPWNPPSFSRTPIPSHSTLTPFARKETPKPSCAQPSLAEGPKRKVSFHETSDDGNYFTADEGAAMKVDEWKVPRKATPATDAFKRPGETPSAFRPTPKQVSFDEDSIGSGDRNNGKSPWVPPRKPTPAKPPPSLSASFKLNSTLSQPATPTVGRHPKKCISKRLTYSMDESRLFGESWDESDDCVGYDVTEYEEEVGSSQEGHEDFEFLKMERRLAKPIPEWATGDQLTMALVKMIPLADCASRQTHIRRIFPQMREGTDNTPLLFPSVGFAPQSLLLEPPTSELPELPGHFEELLERRKPYSLSVVPDGPPPPTTDIPRTPFIKYNYSY